MVYEKAPHNFKPALEAAGCFCQVGNKILFLKSRKKEHNYAWGIPAGKLDANETPKAAMLREFLEETGVTLQDVSFVKKVYIRYPNFNYVFHLIISLQKRNGYVKRKKNYVQK